MIRQIIVILQLASSVGTRKGIDQPRIEFTKCKFESEIVPCIVSVEKKKKPKHF